MPVYTKGGPCINRRYVQTKHTHRIQSGTTDRSQQIDMSSNEINEEARKKGLEGTPTYNKVESDVTGCQRRLLGVQ